MRGRKRIATAIHKRNGTYKNQPGRENKAEPKPQLGIPPTPPAVKADPIARAKWHKTSKQLMELGIMAVTDADLLELYCVTYSNYRKALDGVRQYGVAMASKTSRGKLVLKRNPFETTLNHSMTQLTKIMAELGLSPQARTRLVATSAQPEDDPLLAFLAANSRN